MSSTKTHIFTSVFFSSESYIISGLNDCWWPWWEYWRWGWICTQPRKSPWMRHYAMELIWLCSSKSLFVKSRGRLYLAMGHSLQTLSLTHNSWIPGFSYYQTDHKVSQMKKGILVTSFWYFKQGQQMQCNFWNLRKAYLPFLSKANLIHSHVIFLNPPSGTVSLLSIKIQVGYLVF